MTAKTAATIDGDGNEVNTLGLNSEEFPDEEKHFPDGKRSAFSDTTDQTKSQMDPDFDLSDFEIGDPEDGASPFDKEDAGEEADYAKERESADEEIPAIGDDLRERAAEFGIDDVEGFTPEALEKAIEAFDRRLVASVETKPSEETKPSKAVSDGGDEDSEFAPEFDDLTDPSVVKAFDGMKKVVTQLRAQLTELQSEAEGQQTAAEVQFVDEQFSKLNKGFQKVFGEGGESDFAKTSKEFKNRGRVVAVMHALEEAYEANSLLVPSRTELFKRAVRSEFGGIEVTAERKQIGDQLRDRKGQFTGRPAGRRDTGPTDPTDRAVQAVAAKWPKGKQNLSPMEDFPD